MTVSARSTSNSDETAAAAAAGGAGRSEGTVAPSTTTTITSRLLRCLGSSSSGHHHHLSPNVRYTLYYTFIDGACYSLWGMQLLPLFLVTITDKTTVIGLSATICGTAQLVGAIITGYLADRYARQLSIRAGAVCAVLALSLFLCAFLRSSVRLILVGQALWGAYTGITSTSVEALFADSVRQGHRTSVYNTKWMLQTLCYVVGYVVATVLFFVWHNTWELSRMRAVLIIGVVTHPLALLPLCALGDRHALRDDGDGDVHFLTPSPVSPVPRGAAVEKREEGGDEKRRAAGVAVAPSPRPLLLSSAPIAITTSGGLDGAGGGGGSHSSPGGQSAHVATYLTSYDEGGGSSTATQGPRADAKPPTPLEGEEGENEAGTLDAASPHTQRAEAVSAALLGAAQPAPLPGNASKLPRPASLVFGEPADAVAFAAATRVAPGTAARDDEHSSRLRVCARRLCPLLGDSPLSAAAVPFWMCGVDFILALGSGMSVPFFAPFFTRQRAVSPGGLYIIYILSTVLTAMTSSTLPWLITACGLGRIPTVMAVRVVGTAALLLLATAQEGTLRGSQTATVALFLIRNALMNAVFGVTRSVVMDSVARGSRAKWSAFESVTSLSWAGSAALGGLLTDALGYKVNFGVTAVLQFAATLLMIPAAIGARELDRRRDEEVVITVAESE